MWYIILIGLISSFIFPAFSEETLILKTILRASNESISYKLIPQAASPCMCSSDTEKGMLYYDTGTNQLKVCQGAVLGWQDIAVSATVWTQSGNDVFNTNTGNVGVGTTMPCTMLHVVDDESGQNMEIVTFGRTTASPAAEDSYDLVFQHQNSNNDQESFARIRVIAADVSDGIEDGILTFSTAGSGTIGEVLRITNDKLVSIGGDSAPDAHLEVSAGGTTGGSAFMVSTTHDSDGDLFKVDESGAVTASGSLSVGGAITAAGIVTTTGGLVIENRNEEPTSPAVGRIWLRTDL